MKNLFENEPNSNLWLDPKEYKPRESGLITLCNTYGKFSTLESMAKYLKGTWFDHSFLVLVDGLLSDGTLSRRDAIKPYALTNFVEENDIDRDKGPSRAQVDASSKPYRHRLRKLRPAACLVMTGNSCYDVQEKAIEAIKDELKYEPIVTRHPGALLRNGELLRRDAAKDSGV
jgi:hypothetical protein